MNYHKRFLQCFETIKAELEPFTHCGPEYDRMAAEWFSLSRRRVWGHSAQSDVWQVVRGYAILRTIKGRKQFIPRMDQTTNRLVSRLEA